MVIIEFNLTGIYLRLLLLKWWFIFLVHAYDENGKRYVHIVATSSSSSKNIKEFSQRWSGFRGNHFNANARTKSNQQTRLTVMIAQNIVPTKTSLGVERNQQRIPLTASNARLPDFSWFNLPTWVKIYRTATKLWNTLYYTYTKWPQYIPNGLRINQPISFQSPP
jgi:hypothetical protein